MMGAQVRLGLIVAVVLLLLDQVTKWAMMQLVFALPYLDLPFGSFPWAQPIEVTGFFNLVTVWNQGVSFGLFSNDHTAGPYILSAMALGVSGVLAYLLWRTASVWLALAYGIMIGGALGNIVDRLRFGAVFDFLDFHVAGYHWPAFNVADSTIFIGVAMILLDGLVARRPKDA